MKKFLLFIALGLSTFYSIGQANQSDEIVVNNYVKSFDKAYLNHPEIPKGILEAVSFCNTHFNHIQHSSIQPQSCSGIPNAYGVMGLTLEGQNYFANNLVEVSKLSGYSIDEIITDPEKNILAYSDAYTAIKKSLNITSNSIADQIPVLTKLSELPQGTTGQNFAFNTQLYGYLQFLNTSNYQQLYDFPNYAIDFAAIFGTTNYSVLSSPGVTITDESVYNKSGQQFQTKSMLSTDYGPAAWVASPNYSSRSGTAVSAVVIHDVEGSYSGCISWFQNTSSQVSAHYVLRSSDGQVTQMVLESNKAWHVGSENPYTIGFEHEGYVAQTGWYTNAMYASSAAIVRDICTSGYGISPLRTYYGPGCSGSTAQCGIGACTKIKGHQMYPNQTHDDPGPNWNWAYYYLLINNNPTINTVTGATGNYYDSGGSGGNYSDDERILTLIQPTGATSITINFTSFDTELDWDHLLIYDGATTSAPLLGKFTGTNSPGTITASGGSLLLEFRSDCNTNASGWVANWTSNAVPAPSADSIAPTTTISTTNIWQTGNFTANFTDADNTGGSGLEKSYYQVLDYNGTEWRANNSNGFFADNFDLTIHPDWTSANGTWGINGGSLFQSDETVGTGDNTNIYASLNQTLSNRYLYNFYGKIDGSGVSKRAGFHFFCDNASQSNRGNSYFVWFRVDDAQLQIFKVINNVYGSAVVDIPFTTIANQWYDYKIIYDRITGKISIYRDNQFITSWTDSSPISTGNAISFRSGNSNFAINELKVYRSRSATSTAITVGAANTNDIRYQNPNPTISAGKIKSICADSAGNLSAIFYQDINVDWTPPTAVDTINDGTGADISSTNSTSDLSANWSAGVDTNSAVSRYWYAIGTTPGGTDIVNYTDNWFNQAVTATGLSSVLGQIYYFSVIAEDGAGLQSPVFTSNGQTVLLTSIDEQIAAKGLSVYPNPFTNNASIIYQLTTNSKVDITLTDVLGKEIVLYANASQVSGRHEVSINTTESKLAKGMYFIKLETNKGKNFLKAIVK